MFTFYWYSFSAIWVHGLLYIYYIFNLFHFWPICFILYFCFLIWSISSTNDSLFFSLLYNILFLLLVVGSLFCIFLCCTLFFQNLYLLFAFAFLLCSVSCDHKIIHFTLLKTLQEFALLFYLKQLFKPTYIISENFVDII